MEKPKSAVLRRIGMWVGLFLIPAALLGVQLLLQDEFTKVRDFRQTVDRTVETRDQLSDFLTVHLDLETGVRGFVLTQDEVFLEPYARARRNHVAVIKGLRQRLGSDSTSLAFLERLDANSQRKFALAEMHISDVRAGRADDARINIASGEGRRVMDAIRRDIGELDEIQASKLESVASHGAGTRASIEFIIRLLLIALSLLLAGVALVVGRTSRQRAEALARSERLSARQKAMFDGAVDGMLLLDAKGYITRINPSIIRMFGYAEHELIGHHNTELMNDPFDLESSQSWLASVGKAGVDGAGRRQEFAGRRKDGSLFSTEVAISRVSDEAERRYVAAIRDITAFKRAEEMKNEFVSTVSHELRTPLTSIAGSLGLLSGGAVGVLNDKASRLVEIAHSNCERLIRLINDILDIEKMESGKMHFAADDVDVADLIERTVAANSAFADELDVILSARLSAQPLAIAGDADRLEQLLTNLVSNAIKHSPKGETVEVSAEARDGRVSIEVHDRGAGIPPEFRDRIFGKFAMADSSDSRARGGTGLGLSIAREIAQRHGGTLGFHDREGGGTIFRADMPALVSEPDTLAQSGDLPTIVHVDDDRGCLSVVASAFEDHARVIKVATMDEARNLIGAQQFAGAIIDMGMRHESGGDLIPILRERNPGIPVVIFSAIDDMHEDACADAVLIKSRSSLDDLVKTTIDLLAERGRMV